MRGLPLESQMLMTRFSRAALLAAAIGAGASPCPTLARPLGSVEGLPFWAHPFPYGFVYRGPPEHCIHVEQFEQPFAPPVTEVTVDCGGPPVSARY